MRNGQLVLDIFDGGRLLTRGFEASGFCVVGGPELIFGQDITGWRPPAGRFDGVIGGPPCQKFSQASAMAGGSKAPDLIPEFIEIVQTAKPRFWLMENVRQAPVPEVFGYNSTDYLLDRRSLGIPKRRIRRFTFGLRIEDGVAPIMRWRRAMDDTLPRRKWPRSWFPTHPLDPPMAECRLQPALLANDHRGSPDLKRTDGGMNGLPGWLKHDLQPALLARDGKGVSHKIRPSGVPCWLGRTITVDLAWAAQAMPGSPPPFWSTGSMFTKHGAIRLLGNGVPFDMACHVARAVSIAVLGIDTGSVVRWPEHSLLEIA